MDDETFKSEILRRLDRAVSMLEILAAERLAEKRRNMEEKYLKTDIQRRIWSEIDGRSSLADIAKRVGVSGETVRLLVRDLEQDPDRILEVSSVGRGRYPKKLI